MKPPSFVQIACSPIAIESAILADSSRLLLLQKVSQFLTKKRVLTLVLERKGAEIIYETTCFVIVPEPLARLALEFVQQPVGHLVKQAVS